MKEWTTIFQTYTELKANRQKSMPLWDDISRVTGIAVRPNYPYNQTEVNQSQQVDEFVDDPTSAMSCNQFGDYLVGIMWGTGEDAVSLVPSRYVLELADEATLKDYYSFCSDQLLYHLNHSEAGYTNALKPYAYDQASFGTSGIGLFPNKDFLRGRADNALIARNYGVDNLAIDEGKNGLVEIVYANYNWRTNQIVAEICMEDGVINQQKYAKLPEKIRRAYDTRQMNQRFQIVQGVFPRNEYKPGLKGKLGTRYECVWFMDDGTGGIFYREDFNERAINVARMIRMRGEVYGRSSGTMLLSTIRSVNFMLGQTIEIIEKMANPSLGMWNNAIFGDSVLDTSPNGLTIFNSALAGGKQQPAFPLYDVGNPSGIIEFLIPYLNDKITTAFKIDMLLDSNSESQREISATESMQRYTIRGKSLAGVLLQQKNERLTPDVRRGASILWNMGQLGVNPKTQVEAAKRLRGRHLDARIIPEAVLEVAASGRPWFDIRFNNELEKLTRTESLQNLIQVLNAATAIAAIYPSITKAIDFYQLLSDINNNLDANNKILIGADKFKQIIDDEAKAQAAALAIQATQAGAGVSKDISTANKNNQQAKTLNV